MIRTNDIPFHPMPDGDFQTIFSYIGNYHLFHHKVLWMLQLIAMLPEQALGQKYKKHPLNKIHYRESIL